MIKRLYSLALGAVLLAAAGVSHAAGGAPLMESHVNIGDRASLQRGAALFMNYCAGCHSLGYQRYSRTAKDLGLSEEQVMSYLNFTGAKFGEHMNSAMDPADGEAWFGKAPPDLSLVARAKSGGPDWTYTFLKSFYVDETRPAGWNNTVLVGASMPNVFWKLQGMQRAVYDENGVIERMELAPAGAQSAEEFDRTIRDVSAFLTYVGEPAALKREAYGVWVILFLTVFTFLAWLLKTEYWRDVH
jgi:ubiquinol-cytochrome c reductase cytochrome c1 subunit